MELILKKGPLDLGLRVLAQDLCCACGACMGMCPYFLGMREKVVLFEQCGLTEGRCYEVCPRTVVDMNALNRQVFGRERDDFVLGTHREVLMAQARAEKVQKAGQYGGTVTALLVYALEQGIIDGAIVARWSARYDFMPEPVLARTPEEVIAAAGSKYTACPSLSILDQSLKECKKLAVVGRPCQVTALRKRERVDPEVRDKIALVLGIFCMWALRFQEVVKHLSEQVELGAVCRVDIPFNRFVIITENGPQDLPFEPIRGFRRHTCDYCYDFTSELADLSIGSTEWKEDWNTLITRTARGAGLVDLAKKDGYLAADKFPEERVKLLHQAALGKKKRVIASIDDQTCPIPDYLVLSDAEKEWVRKA